MAEESVAGATVDTLELEIRASAEKAADKIRELSASVGDFGKNIAGYVSDLSNFANAIERIAKAAQSLSGIKNIKDVIGNAASASSAAKAKSVGDNIRTAARTAIKEKAWLINSPSQNVGPRTRYYQNAQGETRRFEKTSDQVAKDLLRDFSMTGTRKDLAARIAEIRTQHASAKSDEDYQKVTDQIIELGREIAGSAGDKNVSSLIKQLNEAFGEYGGKYIGVADRDIAGIGSIKEANAILGNAGASFRFRKWGNGGSLGAKPGIHGADEVFEKLGIDSPEELIDRVAKNSYRSNTHRDFLGEAGFENEEDFFEQIMPDITRAILGDTRIAGKGEIEEAMRAEAQAKAATAKVKAEMDAAFDQYEKQEAKASQKFYNDHPMDWDKWEAQAAAKEAKHAMPDNTEREIAEWKAMEDKRDAESAAEARAKAEAKNIEKEVDAEWKSYAAWNREQDKYYKEDYGGKNKKAQMNLDWKELEAEKGAGQYGVDNTEREIAEWKKLEDAISATKEAKKEYYYSEETKAASEAENARLRSTSREAIEGIKAWNLAKNEGKAADDKEALLSRTLSDNTPERIARAVKTIGVKRYQDFTNNKIPEIADRGVAAGMITPEIAQAMKEAAGYAGEIRRESEMTSERFMQETSQADLLQMKLESVKQKLDEALTAGDKDPAKIARLADQYQKLSEKIREVGDAAKDSGSNTKSFKTILEAVRDTINGSQIGKFVSQFARIARFRAIRGIVKGAAEGIKEGIGNLYQWSKGIGGHFAGAMDVAASKMMLLKNSLATAVAPVIETCLIPLLSKVVSWVNSATNAISQFFALLTGQTSWTAATESAEEWAAATKSGASGAHKEMKDLLADWDELNIIQRETGGNGGGGSRKKAPDYNSMFKEMTVFDKWMDYFDEIKTIVEAIGLGIASWFVLDTIQDFLGKIGIAGETVDGIFANIKRGVAGAVLLTIGFSLASASGKSIAREGLNAKNVLSSIGSLAASALGGKFLGGAIAKLVGGSVAGGGVIGVIAGLTIATAVGIYSYYYTKNEDAKEYIRKNLSDKVYGFDVNAEVESFNLIMKNTEAAREAVRKKASEVLYDIDVVKVGLVPNAYDDLYKSIAGEDGLISKLRTQLEEEKNVIAFYYQLKQKTGTGLNETDRNGNFKNLDSFRIDTQANAWLEGEYTRLGQRFAECFVEGEVNKIKEGKEKLALELATQLAEATNAAEVARGRAEVEVGMINQVNGLDKNYVLRNFDNVIDESNQKLADLEKTSTEQYVIAMSSTLAQLERLGADQTLIDGVKKNIEEAKDRLANADFKAEVELEYKDKNRAFIEDYLKGNFDRSNSSWLNFRTEGMGTSMAKDLTAKEMAEELRGALYSNANMLYGLSADDLTFEKYGVDLGWLLSDQILEGLRNDLSRLKGEDFAKAVFEGLGFDEETVKRVFAKEAQESKPEQAEVPVPKELRGEEGSVAGAVTVAEALKDVPSEFHDEVKGATDELKGAANAWFDVEKEILREQHDTGADPAKEVFDAEESAFNAMEKAGGTEFDEFFSRVMDFIDGLENPWDEEDLPDYLFGEPEPAVAGSTAWYPGLGAEEVELDASAAGLATDEGINNLMNTTANGMSSLDSTLKLIMAIANRIEESARTTAAKDLTVTINPSSVLGRTTGAARTLYGRVTGEMG